MKTSKLLLSLLFLVGIVTFIGCGEDDEPETFTLVSLMAGDIDLAGVSAATDVPEDAPIVAEFSSEVDATTATNSTIQITNTESGVAEDYTVTVSGSTVTITPTDGWDGGSQFTIDLSSSIAGVNGAAFAGNNLTFRTSGIFVPEKESQVLFLSFDESTAVDEAGDHTVNTVETLTFTEDRRGVANSAAYFDGTGNLVEVEYQEDLVNPSTTISFWMKTNEADYSGQEGSGAPQARLVLGLSANNAFFLEMGRRSNDPTSEGYGEFYLKFGSNHKNVGTNADAVPEATVWYEVNSQLNVNYESGVQSGWSYAIEPLRNTNDPLQRSYIREQIMDKWTHVVMTHDAGAQVKTLYINGEKWAEFTWNPSGAEWLFSDLQLKTTDNSGNPLVGIDKDLTLGFGSSSADTFTGWSNYSVDKQDPAEGQRFFKGALDQFRVFDKALSEAQVKTLYDNEK